MGAPLNPNQLKLFMSGTEWQRSITDSTDLSGRGADALSDLWAEKEAQARQPAAFKVHDVQWRGGRGQRVTIGEARNSAHGAGLYDSMKERGYDPTVSHGAAYGPTILTEGEDFTQWEGHHRVAAAAAVERDTGQPVYIPTNYRQKAPWS